MARRRKINTVSNNSIYTHTHTTHTGNTHTAIIPTMPIGRVDECLGCPAIDAVEDVVDRLYLNCGPNFFENVKPELHRVVLTLRARENPYDYFVKEFGQPKQKAYGYIFDNGLLLSKYNISYWYTIGFTAGDETCVGIWRIIERMCHIDDVQLKRVEVMWNLPCVNGTYADAEDLTLKMAENTLPGLVQGRVRHEWSKRKRNRDGTENGRVTAYFNKYRNNKDGEYTRVKKPGWKLKMYPKRMEGTWNVHIEVTFDKRFLIKHDLVHEMPSCLSPNWLKQLPLETFASFTPFCRKKFAEAMNNTDILKAWREEQALSGKRYKRPHPAQVLLAALRIKPACEQKQRASIIAESLGLRRLKQSVNGSEFNCRYNMLEE